MNNPMSGVMLSALSKSLEAQKRKMPMTAKSRTAQAVMLAKPMLLKYPSNTLLTALGANLDLIAAVADNSPEFQEGFKTWLSQVNQLPQ